MGDSPFIDQTGKKYLNHLLDVGPDKPMGYLPLSTLTDDCKVDPHEVSNYLREQGIETREWDDSSCHIDSGALYAYDRNALQQLLNQNLDILSQTGWPDNADDFVEHVATQTAKHPLLIDLVADAFADYQNSLRTYRPEK